MEALAEWGHWLIESLVDRVLCFQMFCTVWDQLVYLVPLNKFYIVLEVLCNVNLCKTIQYCHSFVRRSHLLPY